MPTFTNKEYRDCMERRCIKDCRMDCSYYGMIRLRSPRGSMLHVIQGARPDESVRCPQLEAAMQEEFELKQQTKGSDEATAGYVRAFKDSMKGPVKA